MRMEIQSHISERAKGRVEEIIKSNKDE